MKVEIFALCDAATEFMGKLNLLGTFDSIGARETPASHPACGIALRIRFDRIESGEHKIRMELVNADGQPVVPPLETTANVQIPDGMPSAAINLIVNFQQLKFETFGDYSIDLAIDGRHESSLPLYVREMPAMPVSERDPHASN